MVFLSWDLFVSVRHSTITLNVHNHVGHTCYTCVPTQVSDSQPCCAVYILLYFLYEGAFFMIASHTLVKHSQTTATYKILEPPPPPPPLQTLAANRQRWTLIEALKFRELFQRFLFFLLHPHLSSHFESPPLKHLSPDAHKHKAISLPSKSSCYHKLLLNTVMALLCYCFINKTWYIWSMFVRYMRTIRTILLSTTLLVDTKVLKEVTNACYSHHFSLI